MAWNETYLSRNEMCVCGHPRRHTGPMAAQLCGRIQTPKKPITFRVCVKHSRRKKLLEPASEWAASAFSDGTESPSQNRESRAWVRNCKKEDVPE